MPRYVTKPETVEAEQFHIGELPEILKQEDGRVRITHRVGSAFGIMNALEIEQNGVWSVVHPGCWLVYHAEDGFQVWDDDAFAEVYELEGTDGSDA